MSHTAQAFRAAALAALTIVTPLSQGCATILRGSKQEVTVRCTDPQAKLFWDSGAGRQPIDGDKVSLTRKRNYTISAEADGGKQTAQATLSRKLSIGYLIADILLTGFVGVIVDAISGAWHNLQPEDVSLELKPAESAAAK